MTKRKFVKTYATIIPVIAITALCLTASAARAQTPAQDAANVATDKQAADDAQQAIQKDTAQLNMDTVSKNAAAIQADTATLAADKQALSDANDKSKADAQQLISDDQYFNGTPPAPPPAPAPQAGAKPASGQPQQGGTVPASVPPVPPTSSGYGYTGAPASTAPTPAP